MTEVTDRQNIPSKTAELVFQVSNIGDYIVALVLHAYFIGRKFMILSNVTRRRLIGGLAAGVSAVSVTSPSTFISSARAQSAKKTLFLLAAPFTELGVGIALPIGSKSKVIKSTRLRLPGWQNARTSSAKT